MKAFHLGLAALVAAVMIPAVAGAAPFMTMQMQLQEGTSVNVPAGGTVNFKLVCQMAPVGTSNTSGTGKTITSLGDGTGLSSILFDIINNVPGGASLSQVTYQNGFGSYLLGSSPGTQSSGNLTAIKLGQPTGTFVGGDNAAFIVATGSFTLAQAAVVSNPGATGDEIFDMHGTGTSTATYASMRINGTTAVSAKNNDVDPLVDFQSLVVPEPATMSLLVLGGLGLIRRRRA